MPHQVVSCDAWLKARLELLAAEKDFTRQRDALTCRRQAMPWARVEKPYRLEGGLAAAPIFAIMALLTGVLGGAPDGLCSSAHDASPLGGMVPMYLLMCAFHSAPWLKLLSSR